MASNSKRLKGVEKAEFKSDPSGVDLGLLFPSELLQQIIKRLNDAKNVLRLSLASSSWLKLALENAPSLILGAKALRALSWTNTLGPTFHLSQLERLNLNNSAPRAELLVRFAPRLQYFTILCDPEVFPLDQVFAAVQQHQNINELTIHYLSLSTSLEALLPPNLSTLRLALSRRGQVPEDLISQIATACPNLTALFLNIAPSVQSLEALKRFTKIQQISIPTVKGFPPNAPDRWGLLRTLARILPTPPAPLSRFKSLRIATFAPDVIFQLYYNDLDFLRKVIQLGIRPSPQILAFKGPADRFRSDTGQAQFDFVRVMFEEGEASLPLGVPLAEAQSQWENLSTLQPEASSFLIERYFLPFVAAGSAKFGLDEGSLASALFRNFDVLDQNEATVLNYIRNYSYPLNVGYTLRSAPMLLVLNHTSTRNALIERAVAKKCDLGLATANPQYFEQFNDSHDTPLHSLLRQWDENISQELRRLRPHLAFFETKGLWDVLNSEGYRPFDLVRKEAYKYIEHFDDEALDSLIARYLPSLAPVCNVEPAQPK